MYVKSVMALPSERDLGKMVYVSVMTDDGPYEQEYISYQTLDDEVLHKVRGIRSTTDRIAVSLMTISELNYWLKRLDE